MMNTEDILKRIDHTILKPETRWDEVREIIDDGITFKVASVCIPPYFVKKAAEYSEGKIKICTVIGFPNGYATTPIKVMETIDAVKSGADEIDMVINICMVKDQQWTDVFAEICAVREACENKIFKVIIEACLLTEEEKIRLCQIVSESGADYIKTSTGFSTGGAVFEDVVLMKKNIAPHVKIKAAGGIRSLEVAEKFILLGADRLGASAIVNSLKN